jgi:vancomycin resistance protein VanJ
MNHSSDPASPGGNVLKPLRPISLLRRVVTFSIFGYVILLMALFMAMSVIGERWWPLAVPLYLPQRLFLLPMMVLIPAALLAEVSRGFYAILAGAVIIFLWHVPFHVGIGGSSGPLKIKVISNNYGQNHGLQIQPFIAAEDPDFVALDDAAGQGLAFQRAYPDRTVRAVGQFVFISKAPVKSAVSLAWPKWRGGPIAAVFEVPWQGEDIAIYAIHLPTPRGDFAKLAGLGLLKELAGRNRRRSDDMSFGEAMTARVQLARDLSTVLSHEERPFIAMGDFNMPSNGYVHHVITNGLVDCFAQAGWGFGFTFPCDTNNPLTLGQPWLRLDYILGGPGWRASDCRVEPDRRSQHRAVVATLSRN